MIALRSGIKCKRNNSKKISFIERTGVNDACIPVFKDVYKMTLRIFELTAHFCREYKFTLGQDLKRDCILLVRNIYRANKCKEKVPYLEQFMDSFEVVKLEVRLCRDLKLVSIELSLYQIKQ